MADDKIDFADPTNLGVLIEQLFEPMPEGKRRLMVEWAKRELATRHVVTRVSKRMWADEYKDAEGKAHPGEWQTVVWEVGQASPQNDNVKIFAMLVDDGLGGQGPTGKVAVFSFGMEPAAGEDGATRPVYFKELVYSPDVVYGPLSGEAVYRDFFDFLATDEEREAAAQIVDQALAGEANGAAS
jgi:hypothetical protein